MERSNSDQALIEKLIYLLEDQLESLDLIRADIANKERSGRELEDILQDTYLNLNATHDKLAGQLNRLD